MRYIWNLDIGILLVADEEIGCSCSFLFLVKLGISLSISTKKACWDIYWECVGSIDLFDKNWYHNNTVYSDLWAQYIYTFQSLWLLYYFARFTPKHFMFFDAIVNNSALKFQFSIVFYWYTELHLIFFSLST